MKLHRKLIALLRSRLSPRPEPGRGHAGRRPNPLEDDAVPWDPAQGLGIALGPPDRLKQLLNDFTEQLALETYFGGENFEFTLQELEFRFLEFFDGQVESGALEKLVDTQAKLDREPWLQARKADIERLVDWWRLRGAPDIQPKLM